MSEIVQFPSKHSQTTAPAVSPGAANASSSKCESPTDPPTRATAIASVIAGTDNGSDHGPVLDVARVVGLVLRTCRRLGRKPSRLSPIIANDLERHCELGDPTAILLRDWLRDRSPFHVGIPNAIAVAEAAAPIAGEG